MRACGRVIGWLGRSPTFDGRIIHHPHPTLNTTYPHWHATHPRIHNTRTRLTNNKPPHKPRTNNKITPTCTHAFTTQQPRRRLPDALLPVRGRPGGGPHEAHELRLRFAGQFGQPRRVHGQGRFVCVVCLVVWWKASGARDPVGGSGLRTRETQTQANQPTNQPTKPPNTKKIHPKTRTSPSSSASWWAAVPRSCTSPPRRTTQASAGPTSLSPRRCVRLCVLLVGFVGYCAGPLSKESRRLYTDLSSTQPNPNRNRSWTGRRRWRCGRGSRGPSITSAKSSRRPVGVGVDCGIRVFVWEGAVVVLVWGRSKLIWLADNHTR